jgi:hypothetical protein
MWKCADPELERQIHCFPYREHSDVPRLQQVEQKAVGRQRNLGLVDRDYQHIPVNPPPFCRSLPCKSLISRMDWVSCAGDINLPHNLPPTKKSSTIKSCDQYFWKFPIWNSRADEKHREIRMVKVFKWYPVIDLFDTFTDKLGHGD